MREHHPLGPPVLPLEKMMVARSFEDVRPLRVRRPAGAREPASEMRIWSSRQNLCQRADLSAEVFRGSFFTIPGRSASPALGNELFEGDNRTRILALRDGCFEGLRTNREVQIDGRGAVCGRTRRCSQGTPGPRAPAGACRPFPRPASGAASARASAREGRRRAKPGRGQLPVPGAVSDILRRAMASAASRQPQLHMQQVCRVFLTVRASCWLSSSNNRLSHLRPRSQTTAGGSRS